MGRSTSVDVDDDDGTPIVHHRGAPGPDADAIRHEAAVLERARGLGVVELVAWGDDPDGGATLTTRYVAGGTLADVAGDHGEQAATVVLSRLATILADLHDAGIVHGRCRADHVVGTGTQAALCGLGAASVSDGSAPPDTTVDVAGFAALVHEICDGDGDRARRARLAVTGLAASPPTTNLRVVASELAGLAGIGAAPRPQPQVLRPRRRNTTAPVRGRVPRGPLPPLRSLADQRGAVLAAVAVVVALTVGVAAWRVPGATSESGATSAPQATAAPTSTTSPSTTTPPATTPPATTAPPTTTAPPATTAPPTTTAPPATTAPSTPPAAAAAGPAPLVDHEGVRYEVGEVGDLVVVGDWDCDGSVTPGVVRTGDGSVWIFDRWASGGELAAARAVGVARFPVAATAVPSPEGCEDIAVTTADGDQVVVTPR